MIVLSLFDGISCARVALQRAGFDVELYLASEVDKYAIQVAKKNRSETQHVGNVKSIRYGNGRFECEEGEFDMSSVDLLIGLSPCQDLSIAKKNRQGLDGEKSGLFREYVRILKELKPKRFILENVASMPKEAKQVITDSLGVEPIMINASLVSAQNRKRLFWTNIHGITQPSDKGIVLSDILEKYVEGKFGVNISERFGAKGLCSTNGKSKSLTASCWKGYGNDGVTIVQGINGTIRKLTPIECERLQCLPDEYTAGISNSQRYKCLGNAFNVDVIAHILSFIPKK